MDSEELRRMWPDDMYEQAVEEATTNYPETKRRIEERIERRLRDRSVGR